MEGVTLEMRDPNLEEDDAMFLRQFAALYRLQAADHSTDGCAAWME